MSILFSPEAEADLRAIVEFLRARNPPAARRLADRIVAVIDLLAAGDIEGPANELTSREVVRSWAVPPVRSYHQRHSDALWVVRNYDLRQAPIER